MRIPDLRVSFRTGFCLGLLLAAVIGLYLYWLWEPQHQVRLHSAHLIEALEDNDWAETGEFLDTSYADQWGHDRGLLLTRLRQVLTYARHLRIETIGTPRVDASSAEAVWAARITIEADPNEVSTFIKERINPLEEPFELRWRHQSGKPWDWKLVRVTNPSLELSSGGF